MVAIEIVAWGVELRGSGLIGVAGAIVALGGLLAVPLLRELRRRRR